MMGRAIRGPLAILLVTWAGAALGVATFYVRLLREGRDRRRAGPDTAQIDQVDLYRQFALLIRWPRWKSIRRLHPELNNQRLVGKRIERKILVAALDKGLGLAGDQLDCECVVPGVGGAVEPVQSLTSRSIPTSTSPWPDPRVPLLSDQGDDG